MLVWITVTITLVGLAAYAFLVARYGDLISTANSRGLATNSEPDRSEPKRPPRRTQTNPYLRLGDAMMVFVSVAVLCSSLFIILSGRYDDAAQKWAFGSVGSIFGFWCRRK